MQPMQEARHLSTLRALHSRFRGLALAGEEQCRPAAREVSGTGHTTFLEMGFQSGKTMDKSLSSCKGCAVLDSQLHA